MTIPIKINRKELAKQLKVEITKIPRRNTSQMKEILYNLAMIDTLNFCKAHNINCSGTHLIKYPRQYIYALVKDITGRAIVTVTLHKSSVPTHTVTTP